MSVFFNYVSVLGINIQTFVVDQRRSRSRSRSSSHGRGIPVVYKLPLGTKEMLNCKRTEEMLTRKEFRCLQHTLRLESAGLVPPVHSTLRPSHPIPIHNPAPMMYPAPVAPSGQHLPPLNDIILTRQPMILHPAPHERPEPYPGLHMQPTMLMPAPSHDPGLGVHPGLPLAHPLPPGVITHAPPPGPPLGMPPGNPGLMPFPNSFHLHPR